MRPVHGVCGGNVLGCATSNFCADATRTYAQIQDRRGNRVLGVVGLSQRGRLRTLPPLLSTASGRVPARTHAGSLVPESRMREPRSPRTGDEAREYVARDRAPSKECAQNTLPARARLRHCVPQGVSVVPRMQAPVFPQVPATAQGDTASTRASASRQAPRECECRTEGTLQARARSVDARCNVRRVRGRVRERYGYHVQPRLSLAASITTQGWLGDLVPPDEGEGAE